MGPGKSAPVAVNCPQHIEWNHVASGLWPQWKAKQAMMHAALCEHCGPLLRSAVQKACVASPQEEDLEGGNEDAFVARSQPTQELASTSLEIDRTVGPSSSRSGDRWAVEYSASYIAACHCTQFAELAVRTHRQHVQGELVLDIRSESLQTVNDWLKRTSPFSLVLPADPGTR